MRLRVAHCACGQLGATCSGEPVSVSLCHCLACQRRTGSTYGIAAFFTRDAVAVSGRTSSFSRPSDSGHSVTHHFCPDCGSTVHWVPSRKPEMVAVAAGAFADPTFPAPTKGVHGEHRHPWVALPF